MSRAKADAIDRARVDRMRRQEGPVAPKTCKCGKAAEINDRCMDCTDIALGGE